MTSDRRPSPNLSETSHGGMARTMGQTLNAYGQRIIPALRG